MTAKGFAVKTGVKWDSRWGRTANRAVLNTLTALTTLAVLLTAGCGDTVLNNPYPPSEQGKNVYYTSFDTRPKHLDPVQSYSENEAHFTHQIYEPPLQYHYLRRPYQLIPGAAAEMPKLPYLDANGRALPDTAASGAVAFSQYDIKIRPGIKYQPHPSLAVDAQGKFVYENLSRADLRDKYTLADFKALGTRELVADDYVYQIKRLAHPHLHSPVLELMSDFIVGLKDLHQKLVSEEKARSRKGQWIDLRNEKVAGVEALDRYTYRIRLEGKYPQFSYWLAMPFFAPIPWEADRFHAQPGMADRNLTLDWYPIGTGPFMLTENNPNARMVLERNPNFDHETYPCDGEPEDGVADEAGKSRLADCGKKVPFLDKVVFVREREGIPYWNKFLQGYYDASGVASDNFDQAVQISSQADVGVSEEMLARGIRLETSVAPTIRYYGFNMLDPLIGTAAGEPARKIRQAISIAIDEEEFISIFMNGRGIPGQGPIPPGIFGNKSGKEGINPYVYDWVNGAPKRKSVEYAKKLIAEAGYPNGRSAKNGEPLVINLDTTGGGVGDKSRMDWLTRQFAKIDIQLVVRSTDYNRFQEKMRKGSAQLFYWGWNADYPDPENFLFLFISTQSKVKTQGENAANYSNPQFDALFEQMKVMPNGPERQAVVDKAVDILRRDAPWQFGHHEKEYALLHGWLHNQKPGKIVRTGLKYQRIDVAKRAQLRAEWNRPLMGPLLILFVVLAALVVPAVLQHRRRENLAGRSANAANTNS